MRRAGGYANPGLCQNSYEMLEEENDNKFATLSSKVQELKSLSIDIGHEVKYQNKMLNEMDNEFDSVTGFLSGAMNRLTALTKKGHHKPLCYLLLFCFFVFFMMWIIYKFK